MEVTEVEIAAEIGETSKRTVNGAVAFSAIAAEIADTGTFVGVDCTKVAVCTVAVTAPNVRGVPASSKYGAIVAGTDRESVVAPVVAAAAQVITPAGKISLAVVVTIVPLNVSCVPADIAIVEVGAGDALTNKAFAPIVAAATVTNCRETGVLTEGGSGAILSVAPTARIDPLG